MSGCATMIVFRATVFCLVGWRGLL